MDHDSTGKFRPFQKVFGGGFLHNVAAQGKKDALNSMLGNGYDIHGTDSAMSTPLQRAAAEGHLEIVMQLIRHGADSNRQDLIHGNCALHEASWRGYSQTVNFLCKAGANPNIVNRAGFSPLHLACQNGHNQTTRYLVLSGAFPDQQNSYGDTALHTAARYGHAGVTRILLSGNANINVQNKNGDTALHIAAAMGRRRLTRILLESGCDMLLKNKQDETALFIALRKDYKEVVQLLSSPPPLKSREERWKERKQRGHGRSRSKNSDDSKREKSEGGSSRDSGGRHKKKRQKSQSSDVRVSWSPYGCHATPDLAEVLSPKIKNLPQDSLRDGEQYFLDLGGNIKKGPIGITTPCYCGPFLHRLECHLVQSKQEIVVHVDKNHEQLNNKIDSLEKNTRRQLAGLQRTVDSLGLESSSVGIQKAAEKLEPKRHSSRKLDKKLRVHKSQYDLPKTSDSDLPRVPESKDENHYLEMFPTCNKQDDIYITRADMQSTLDRLGLEGGRYDWNGQVIDANHNVTFITKKLNTINVRKEDRSMGDCDQNRFVTEAIVHSENFKDSSSKLNDSHLSLSISTETNSQSTNVSERSKAKVRHVCDVENQRASSDSGIGLLPQAQDLSRKYSVLVNSLPNDHERELLKIIDQYQEYSTDESGESGLEDEIEDVMDSSKEISLPPPMSLSLTNAKKYTAQHSTQLHEIGSDNFVNQKNSRYGPEAKYSSSELRMLSPISEEKSRLSEYSTKTCSRFDPITSLADEDKHNDSGYSSRIGISSEGTSPALSGARSPFDVDPQMKLPNHLVNQLDRQNTYIDQSIGLPNPDQWHALRRHMLKGKLSSKNLKDLDSLPQISNASLV
ncbi:uncharacterized protein LOC136031022 isoform X2 [Artemia franciscana]|uniref:uncharacterized protein LOC136031022 isoform X2 n=1 Tax=Artemia franciscana TaxID=6661 RepID=UPI0032DAB022